MWPEAISVSLWPYALKYTSDRHNHLTLNKHGYTPLERISRTRSQIAPEILHTWGCPTYVLDARNQSHANTCPKWEPRSRLGVNLGFSPCHSTTVALVLNPKTGHFSPQYHEVFDDEYSMLPYMRKQAEPHNWEQLLDKATAKLSSADNNNKSNLGRRFDRAHNTSTTNYLSFTVRGANNNLCSAGDTTFPATSHCRFAKASHQ